jgi:hypothetical protein
MASDGGDVTQLLKAMKTGDPSAAERLLPLVYAELHRLASSYVRRERQDRTSRPRCRWWKLRYFGSLSVEHIASVLSIAPRSVKRDWALARIWLFKELRLNPDQVKDRRD